MKFLVTAKQIIEELEAKLGKQAIQKPKPQAAEDAVTAKLFEEIKVMFRDLASGLELRRERGYPAPSGVRKRRADPQLIWHLSRDVSRDRGDPLSLIIALSFFRDDAPWLFELGVRYMNSPQEDRPEQFSTLKNAIVLAFDSPFARDIFGPRAESKEFRESFHMLLDVLHSTAG